MDADGRSGRTKHEADRKLVHVQVSVSGGNKMAAVHLDRRQSLRLLGVEALDLCSLDG